MLKRAGCQKIFREKVSGFKRQRPEFQRMLDQIRPGDVIVVWKLDRLARSTRDLLNTMDTINEAGGKFQSVSEPWADTTTHAGKMIMTVFAGIAEFERDLIRERTGAGREAAKQRGVRFGRPRKLNSDQAEVAAQLLAAGKPVRDVARTFNVHEVTITAWLLRRDYGSGIPFLAHDPVLVAASMPHSRLSPRRAAATCFPRAKLTWSSPCRISGALGLAEQARDLRPLVSRQRRNAAGGRA